MDTRSPGDEFFDGELDEREREALSDLATTALYHLNRLSPSCPWRETILCAFEVFSQPLEGELCPLSVPSGSDGARDDELSRPVQAPRLRLLPGSQAQSLRPRPC